MREGLKGAQSRLFYEYVRVLEEVTPKFFLLENVGRMKKEDEEIITEILGVQPVRINSEKLSPQLRNRYYWTNIPIQKIKDTDMLLNDVLTTGYSDREKARCLLESDSRPLKSPVKMFHRYFSSGFTTLIFKSEKHYNECKEHYIENFKGKSAREIDQYKGDLSVYDGLRYLNQKELESMQTLPPGYTKMLSRNKAASVIGDGWTIDVIAHIFKGLKGK